MFAQTRLFIILGLGALMTPVLAAETTTPTCGDPAGPSVECSADGKNWTCPPSNTCGAKSPDCHMTFQPCTPSSESTTAPKTTSTAATKSEPAPTSSGTGTLTSSAPAKTSTAAAAPGLVVGSWTAAVMGIVAGGLVI